MPKVDNFHNKKYMDNEKSRLGKVLSYNFIKISLTLITGTLSPILIIKDNGLEGFGIFSLASASAYIFFQIFEFGLSSSFLREGSKVLYEASGKIFHSTLVLRSISAFTASIAIYLFSELNFFNFSTEVNNLLKIYSFFTIFYILNPFLSQSALSLKMVKIPVLGEIVSKLTYLLGVVLFSSSNKLELDTFVYIISVSGALYSVILLFGILKLFPFKVANIEIYSTYKNLKNSYKYYLNSLLILFYGRVDVIILSKITSSKELGVYTLGYRVTEIISEIGFNAITYYFRELIEKGRNFLAQSIKIVLNIIYFLISLGLIFGFNIAKYLNYDQAKFTKILSVFALAGVFMLLNQLSQFILISESKPYYISVAIIPSIITEIILVYQLGIRYGSTGASLGLLVSEILFFIVLAKFTKINKYNFYNYLTIPLVVSLALILTNSFNVSVALFIILIIGLMIRINKIRKGKMDV